MIPRNPPETGLQEQVARLVRQQQELIAMRERLDREVARLEQIHEFYADAMMVEDQDALARLSVEAASKIFEVEVAALIAVDWPSMALGQVVVCHGADPAMFDLRATHALHAGISAESRRTYLWDAAASGSLVGPGFDQLGAAMCSGSDGTHLAMLVVGVRAAGSRIGGALETEQVGSLSLMAHQIGSLMQARWRSARMAADLHRLGVETQRLQLALEGSAAGLWDWHVDTSRVFYSLRWKQMLGHADDEIGDDFGEWENRIHPEDREASLERVRTALRGPGQHYENTHRLRHADGRYVWVMSRGAILRDAEGRGRRMVGIHIDLTGVHGARERVEAAHAASSEFLATMSHEIRTPLNGVTGMLELLRDADLSMEQSHYIDVAHDCANQLMSVINGALDLSRLESADVAFERLPFDPGAELGQAAELLCPQLQAKGLKLEVVVEQELPAQLLGDAARLRHVVYHLVSNACKFTPTGTVRLRIGGGFLDEAYELRFSVSDTGIGIAPEAIPTLFEFFVHGDTSSARRFGGSGLGLAICQRLVTGMGGSIQAHSSVGHGSRFTVRVPLGLASPAGTGGRSDGQQRPNHDGVRVLLVEDNTVNQMVAKAMLEGIGCRVDVASSGPAALAILARSRFDLVFMDVRMPHMDGLEATRELRKTQAAYRTPVVALTANVLEQTRQECMAAGMDDFVSKPVTKAVLAEVVARWVPGSTAEGRGYRTVAHK